MITSSVAIVGAMTMRARRPLQIRSGAPLEFDLKPEESYRRIFAFVSSETVGTHTWSVKDNVEKLYIIAELKYRDENKHNCDAIINFDFAEIISGHTTVRWSCQFLHWCDKETASRMQKLIDSWIETALIGPLVVPPSAMPTQLTMVTRPAKVVEEAPTPKTSFISNVIDTLKVRGQGQTTIQSSAPLEFDTTLSESYVRMHEMCSRGEVGAYTWKIKESYDDAYIIGQLNYNDAKDKIKFAGEVHFDFSEVVASNTTIRWSAQLGAWTDTLAAPRVINNWITTTLAPPVVKLPPEKIPVDTPLHSNFSCNYPKDFAYNKLLQKLSANTEVSTKWKLNECFKGRSIAARVEHHAASKPDAKCSADVTFQFRELENSTLVDWTYRFSKDTDPELFLKFKELTDEWLQLLLRKI